MKSLIELEEEANIKAEIAYHKERRFKPNLIQRMFGMTEDCLRKRHERKVIKSFGYY